jgi:preprotein translocase subunit SecF
MLTQPSPLIRASAYPSSRRRATTVKTVLTTAMSLLSIFVFGLGAIERDALWLWIGFICCLISGVFIQLFINRIKDDITSGRR